MNQFIENGSFMQASCMNKRVMAYAKAFVKASKEHNDEHPINEISDKQE